MAKRLYDSKGNHVPSVTTIVNGINNGAVMNYLRTKMTDEAKSALNERRVIGELAHEMIMVASRDNYSNYANYTEQQVAAASVALERFEQWRDLYKDFRVLETEKTVVSDELQFGGRFDLYALADGKYLLCEIKTSNIAYDEHVWQLAGYWKLVKDIVPVDELHVVCCPFDKDANYMDYYVSDGICNAAVGVFDAAFDVYKARKKYRGIAG